MEPGDLYIKEEPAIQAIGIYKYKNQRNDDGTYKDEHICSLYSVDLLDTFLEALHIQQDALENIKGYPHMVIEDDLVSEEEFNSIPNMDNYANKNNIVDES